VSLQIIIRGKTKYGRTRGEQEDNLRKDGLTGMDEDKYQKIKWVEKKLGLKDSFIRQADIK
jgi:hypothetical protein